MVQMVCKVKPVLYGTSDVDISFIEDVIGGNLQDHAELLGPNRRLLMRTG
ncbi:hypothetical protein SAMN04488542_112107 [Fontibacillus panacisegetis]|uniref:Uncharacterized protein n=1 Tax=Fontibacillus panacisegetis TaxID=670482 RepID=A0A1G7LY87_9BACL|nr:hypothetical protein [Fontibacillus panacisegetis]SDF54413.1 hypothetical protein SAMN04488542_112107 [Fontibacillus panacisegetis]